MRSVNLVAPRTLELQDFPLPPDPGPGEVLVRIRAVGICGSDLHWFWDGRIGRRTMVYPQVLGHEGAGEIVAAGPGVALEPGARVFVEPSIHCHACEFCHAGLYNLCPKTRFIGSTPTPGMLTEYMLAPAANIIPIPDSMDYPTATLLEPVAIVLHVLDLVKVKIGDTVAVSGAGPIGLLTIAAARAAGASRIFAAEKVPERLALAKAMGADVLVDARAASLSAAVMDETGGRGVDASFEAAGDRDGINEVIRSTHAGRSVALIGLSAKPDMDIDFDTVMTKELRLNGMRRSNHNNAAAMAMLSAGRIPTAVLTHRMALECAPQAFDMLANHAGGAGKVVIENL